MPKRRKKRRVVLDQGYLLTMAGGYAVTSNLNHEREFPGNAWKFAAEFQGKLVTLVAEVL